MHKINILLATLAAWGGLTAVTLVEARPSPARLGICYQFAMDELQSTLPCVVHSGYGAGGSWVSLEMAGHKFAVETSYLNETEKAWLNGEEARSYARNAAFLHEANETDAELGEPLIDCYQSAELDVCYSVN